MCNKVDYFFKGGGGVVFKNQMHIAIFQTW